MSPIVTLEQKLGRFAIPNLVRFIATLQFLNWFLIKWNPGFFSKLAFVPELILSLCPPCIL